MDPMGDGSISSNEFRKAKEVLLGSESPQFVMYTEKGFLVLSDRRLVVLEEKKKAFEITNAIPYDLIMKIEVNEKEEIVVHCFVTNHDGVIEADDKKGEIEFSSFEIKVRPTKSVSSGALKSYVSELADVLAKIQREPIDSTEITSKRDLRYLDYIPEELTKDAVLNLNILFSDHAEEDFMISPARDMFGESPVVVFNTVNRSSNGYLFVVGTNRIVNVEGQLKNQELRDATFDIVINETLESVTTNWEKVSKGDVRISFSLQLEDKTKYLDVRVQWEPPDSVDYSTCRWFQEPANAPWIIADFLESQNFGLVPANHFEKDVYLHEKIRTRRFYY